MKQVGKPIVIEKNISYLIVDTGYAMRLKNRMREIQADIDDLIDDEVPVVLGVQGLWYALDDTYSVRTYPYSPNCLEHLTEVLAIVNGAIKGTRGIIVFTCPSLCAANNVLDILYRDKYDHCVFFQPSHLYRQVLVPLEDGTNLLYMQFDTESG